MGMQRMRWPVTSTVLVLLWFTCASESKSPLPKIMRKELKKLGCSEGQFEALEMIAKAQKEGRQETCYLSFLSGKKERRAVKKLCKEHLPSISVKKHKEGGSQCLVLRVGGESAEEETAEMTQPEKTKAKSQHQPAADPPAGKAPKVTVKQPVVFVKEKIGEVDGDLDLNEEAHLKYMKAIAKRVRHIEMLEKRKEAGQPLDAAQDAKLERKHDAQRELASALRKAEMNNFLFDAELKEALHGLAAGNGDERLKTNYHLMMDVKKEVEAGLKTGKVTYRREMGVRAQGADDRELWLNEEERAQGKEREVMQRLVWVEKEDGTFGPEGGKGGAKGRRRCSDGGRGRGRGGGGPGSVWRGWGEEKGGKGGKRKRKRAADEGKGNDAEGSPAKETGGEGSRGKKKRAKKE